jgi:predicted dehydrogenase
VGLRVGVIGTGKLGKQHVRVLKRVPEVEQVGCYDVIEERSRGVAAEFGVEAFSTVDALLAAVDAVSIVVPTSQHAEVSLQAIGRGKNLFLEKPIAGSVEEGERIVDAARSSQRILQVGHIERFNHAVKHSLPLVDSPSFIEIHRLAPFNIRGIDVSVVMDLMIHDLDLLCLFMGEVPVEIRAKGAGILTDSPDIVNARLEYANGCVANLTASRVSLEPMRKVRIFSDSRYLSIDLLKRKVKHMHKKESFESGVRMLKENHLNFSNVSLEDFVAGEDTEVQGEEPLYDGLRSFCRTVISGERPAVTGEDALRALKLAVEIQQIIEANPVR